MHKEKCKQENVEKDEGIKKNQNIHKTWNIAMAETLKKRRWI